MSKQMPKTPPPQGRPGEPPRKEKKKKKRSILPWLLLIIVILIGLFLAGTHFGLLPNIGEGFFSNTNNSNNNNKQDETKKGGESEQTKAGQSDSTVEQSEEEKGTAVRILAVSDKYYIEGVEKSLDDIAKVIDDADENTRFVIEKNFPADKSLADLKSLFLEKNVSFTESD